MAGLSLDPRARLGLLLCASTLSICLDRPESLGLLTLCAVLPLLALRVERRWLGAGLAAALTLTWSTALSQGLFYDQEPRVALAQLGPLVLYREGLRHGLVQSLRLLSMTFGGLALSLSTPPDRLFAAMLALRVPFGAAFLAVTALRFTPAVASEWWTVRQARRTRGRPSWARGPVEWLRLEVSLLLPVVARCLRRARALAESLDARGFDPVAPRSARHPLRWSRLDVVVLGLAGALTAAAVAVRVLYLLYTAGVLYLPMLRPVYGWVRRWM